MLRFFTSESAVNANRQTDKSTSQPEGHRAGPAERKRYAEAVAEVMGLPPGERLLAVSRIVEALFEDDRAARVDATALERAQRETQRLQDECAALQLRTRELESERDSLASRLDSEKKEAAALRETSAAYRGQLDAARKRLSEHEAAAARQREEAEKLRVDAERYRQAAASAAAKAECTRCGELQRRAIELQDEINRRERDATEKAARHDAELKALRAQVAAGAAGPAAANTGGDSFSGLAERLQRVRGGNGAASPLDAAGAAQAMDVYEALGDGVLRINDIVCALLRKREGGLVRFQDQCRAYLRQPMSDLVRNCMSPETGSVRVVQHRVGRLQAWLRALLFGSDAAADPQFVSRALREALTAAGREWKGTTTLQRFVDMEGPARLAMDLDQRRIAKVEEAFETELRGG